jgi:hypothetical protein
MSFLRKLFPPRPTSNSRATSPQQAESQSETLPQEGRPQAETKQSSGPPVQRVEIASSSRHFAAALFVQFIEEEKIRCDCGGKWQAQAGDLYRCAKCGTEKIFQVVLTS